METIVSLFILAFAASMDSFGVGMTYGFRQVRVPIRSIAIITICSAMMIFVAFGVAQGILLFLPTRAAEILGGMILIGLGIWAMYNMRQAKFEFVAPHQPQTEVACENDHETPRLKLGSMNLGTAVQLLRTPMSADLDESGDISASEALLLGIALSMDAFVAGISAALFGFPAWLTALLVGVMSGLFVYLGIRFGTVFSRLSWTTSLKYTPGMILILMGLMKSI